MYCNRSRFLELEAGVASYLRLLIDVVTLLLMMFTDHSAAESGVDRWDHDLRDQSDGNGADQAGQGSLHPELGQAGNLMLFFLFLVLHWSLFLRGCNLSDCFLLPHLLCVFFF